MNHLDLKVGALYIRFYLLRGFLSQIKLLYLYFHCKPRFKTGVKKAMLPYIIKSVFDQSHHPTHEDLAAANHKIARLEEENRSYRELEYIQQGKEKLEQQVEFLKIQKEKLDEEIESIESYVSDFEIQEFLENFGFREVDYDLETSGEYEIKLREIKKRQCEMLTNNTAIYLNQNPSKDQQTINPRILNVFGKILLSAFNSSCYQIILDVTYAKSDYNAQRRKIVDLVEYIKLLSIPIRCFITVEYERLKFTELYICHMAQKKKYEEVLEFRQSQQHMKRQDDIMKKIDKDLKAAKKREEELKKAIKTVRQQAKYQSNSTQLETEINNLERELKAVTVEKKELNTRSQLMTGGYIYVASNIGSFGKDTCIIGMTQELNPLDYVKNLGNESVPFDFDLHTLVFSGNAIEMKNRIHQKFSQRRLNQVNEHKDFFKVSLDEVKLAIKEMMAQDKTAKSKMKFVTVPKAKEYHDTIVKICNNLS